VLIDDNCDVGFGLRAGLFSLGYNEKFIVYLLYFFYSSVSSYKALAAGLRLSSVTFGVISYCWAIFVIKVESLFIGGF